MHASSTTLRFYLSDEGYVLLYMLTDTFNIYILNFLNIFCDQENRDMPIANLSYLLRGSDRTLKALRMFYGITQNCKNAFTKYLYHQRLYASFHMTRARYRLTRGRYQLVQAIPCLVREISYIKKKVLMIGVDP